MYTIGTPQLIKQIIAIFYGLRIWDANEKKIFDKTGIQLFYSVYYVSFVGSIAGGAFTTNDLDDRIFLTALSILGSVHTARMFYIIWRKENILKLIQQVGTHSTNEFIEFIQVSNKIQKFVTFARLFVLTCSAEIIFNLFFPVFSSKKILINIAFPYKNSQIVSWVKYAYIQVACIHSIFWSLLSILIWYLMLNCVILYQILGNHLRHIGSITTTDGTVEKQIVTKSEEQQLFLKDLIVTIKAHQNINETVNLFASTFSNLFFIQIVTSSICITGSVYILAFNSHENLLRVGFYCIMLFYNLIDILVVMYLGNEMKLASGRLSYCLFEANWTEQTYECRKNIVFMIEILKKPCELIIGKLYPLNLTTFSTIVNRAYSMFNILRSPNLQH